MFKSSGCKKIEFRKLEFAAKTQFLSFSCCTRSFWSSSTLQIFVYNDKLIKYKYLFNSLKTTIEFNIFYDMKFNLVLNIY